MKGSEQAAQFYDAKVRDVEHWTAHYTRSQYFPVWTVIADRLRSLGCTSVLDIGCGSGQLAALLADRDFPSYLGVDFSAGMIAQARRACPAFEFRKADIRTDSAPEDHAYDCVIMLEFLEHIDDELSVIERIRPGAMVLATVPNFPARSHVRHFTGEDAVADRYAPLFAELDVASIRANERGSTFYVMQGIR